MTHAYFRPSVHSVAMLAMVAMVASTGLVGCDKKPDPVPAAPAPATSVAVAVSVAAPAPVAPAAPAAVAKAKHAAKRAPLEKVATEAKKELPAEWEQRDHAEKGFAFWVPKGVKEEQQSKEGVDVYMAQLPAPHDKVGVFVVAFKDPAKKFADLTEMVEKILKDTDTGADYKVDKTEEVNDAYRVLTVSYKDKDGKRQSVQALLALDVTDRYIMMVGTDSETMKADQETVDTILANFEMYASGKGE